MSVRYTATWYDVTQARQQEHTPYTQTRTGPAGRSSGQCVCVCPCVWCTLSVARSQKNFRPIHLKSSANLRKSSANFQKHQFHNALYSILKIKFNFVLVYIIRGNHS